MKVQVKAQILALALQGESVRKIAKKLGLCKSVVGRVFKARSPDSKRAVRGRPSKLSPSDKRTCVRSICRDPKANATTVARSLREAFRVEVVPQTVRRVLREQGMWAYEKKAKPCHCHWTKADWRRVVWTDETKVNRFNSDGRTWAWIRDSEELQPRQVKQTVKHGGGNIMIWGCIMAQGTGYICQIEGTMNKDVYQSILNTHLENSFSWYNINKKKIIFQQDNDPKHTAKSIQQWLEDQPFSVLSWPAQSPDLNPIEHIWALLKRRLSEYEAAPSGLVELWERVQDVWNKISQQDCLKVIDSMPDRIQAVLKARGRWTAY
jgi:transposase